MNRFGVPITCHISHSNPGTSKTPKSPRRAACRQNVLDLIICDAWSFQRFATNKHGHPHAFKCVRGPVMDSEEQHGSQWSSGLFDVCALGAGACMYTFLCEACAYADLSVEFRGGDTMTWWVTCFFAYPGACCSFPCHYLCIHPELRRLIAIKHGKNVKCRSARNRWTCCSLEAAALDDAPCRKTIRVTPCARPRAAAAVQSYKRRSRWLAKF